MLKLIAIVLCLHFGSFVFAEPIKVICDEFADAQVQEMTDVVRAVEEQSSRIFGVDVTGIDDDALIELHLQYLDYKRVDEELNNGRFRRNWSFSNGGARQSHIALQPPVPTEMMDVVGLPLQTKIEIAHSAVHLCMYRAFPNSSSHTGWFSEGLAVYIAEEAVRSIDAMGSKVSEPWTSTEIIQVVDYFDEHPKFGIDDLLNDVDKDIPGSRMYAMRGLFIQWLDELGLLNEVVSEARRFGGGDSYAQKLNSRVDQIMLDAEITDRDSQFRSWLAEFEPQWEQLNRSLQASGELWSHSAFSSRNANCWNNQELGDGNWEISGSMMIFEAEKTQLNILLGRSENGYISVAITANWGVTVFYRHTKDDRWERLENVEVKSNDVDEWIDFKITNRKDRLMIKIGKQRPIRIDASELDLSGAWGLGCQNKSAGVWKNVKIEN